MNRITKIAKTEIDNAADTGQEFSIEDVTDEVFQQVKDLGIADEELKDLCRKKVDEVDRQSHAGVTGQLDLFTGEDASLDHILMIGPNLRIKKRNATFAQWFAGRSIEQKQFADQAAAEAQKTKIDSVLTAIWIDHPQWTYEQVLAEYRKTL